MSLHRLVVKSLVLAITTAELASCNSIPDPHSLAGPRSMENWLSTAQKATLEDGVFADLPAQSIMVPDVSATSQGLSISDRLNLDIERPNNVARWLEHQWNVGMFQLRLSQLSPPIITATYLIALDQTGADTTPLSAEGLYQDMIAFPRADMIERGDIGLVILYHAILHPRWGRGVAGDLLLQDVEDLLRASSRIAQDYNCKAPIGDDYHKFAAMVGSLSRIGVASLSSCAEGALEELALFLVGDGVNPLTDTNKYVRDACSEYCGARVSSAFSSSLSEAARARFVRNGTIEGNCTITSDFSLFDVDQLTQNMSDTVLRELRVEIESCLAQVEAEDGWILQTMSARSVWATVFGSRLIGRLGLDTSVSQSNALQFGQSALYRALLERRWIDVYGSTLLLRELNVIPEIEASDLETLRSAFNRCVEAGDQECIRHIGATRLLVEADVDDDAVKMILDSCGDAARSIQSLRCVASMFHAAHVAGLDFRTVQYPLATLEFHGQQRGFFRYRDHAFESVIALRDILRIESAFAALRAEEANDVRPLVEEAMGVYGCAEKAVYDRETGERRFIVCR